MDKNHVSWKCLLQIYTCNAVLPSVGPDKIAFKSVHKPGTGNHGIRRRPDKSYAARLKGKNPWWARWVFVFVKLDKFYETLSDLHTKWLDVRKISQKPIYDYACKFSSPYLDVYFSFYYFITKILQLPLLNSINSTTVQKLETSNSCLKITEHPQLTIKIIFYLYENIESYYFYNEKVPFMSSVITINLNNKEEQGLVNDIWFFSLLSIYLTQEPLSILENINYLHWLPRSYNRLNECYDWFFSYSWHLPFWNLIFCLSGRRNHRWIWIHLSEDNK